MSTDTPQVSDNRQPQSPAIEQLRRLRSICTKALKRAQKKREKQAEELEEARSAALFQQTGESILAHKAQLRRGMETIEIPNVHTGKPMPVQLNPALSPVENAEMYFRKSKKARRGFEVIEAMIASTGKEIARIHGLIAGIDASCAGENPSQQALEQQFVDGEEALRDLGVLPRRATPSPTTGRTEEHTPYRHLTVDGWDIFVGRNDTQNDELSTRFAKPWDIWLHVAGHAGSHVVIRRQKNAEWPPKRIIEIAAGFSVWFSKAKHTSYAEVHVTERRFVHKRHGAPPGQVVVDRCKSVRVSPRSPQEFFKSAGPGEESDQWDG
jgi:predicted ribosome quality control (RQC) complex YloA/Tae2 family protein